MKLDPRACIEDEERRREEAELIHELEWRPLRLVCFVAFGVIAAVLLWIIFGG